MPHTNQPVWNSRTSPIKNPVLLIEGRTKRIVDDDEITYRVDGGRAILGKHLGSQTIKSDPVKIKVLVKNPEGVLEEKIVIKYSRRTVKVVRRLSSPPGLRGQSSKMTPGRPTDGNIDRSNYGRLLDGFVAGHRPSRRMFAARRTPRWRGGVPHSLTMETTGRAILFMPGEGKVTQYGAARKVKPIRKTSDGWEVGDKTGWTLITEREAQELIANGEGVVRE